MSTNLSLIALLGLALVPLVPHGAALTKASIAQPPAPAVVPAPAAIPAPVEVVRAKPVLVPQTPLPFDAAVRVSPPPAAAAQTEEEASEKNAASSSLRVLARASRERRRRLQRQEAQSGEGGKAAAKTESGELGKAGAKTATPKTPVPTPDTKSEAAKAEPPEPDVWPDAEIITALKDCLKRLAPLGAEIDIAPPVKHEQCGNAAPVLLKRIGSGANRVEFQPPPMVNCAMVASLHTWVEKTLQPTAQDVLGTSITRLRGSSGYACRNRNGSRTHSDRLSEHALANAVDIMGFVTADGRTIDVVSKWGPTARDIREQKERLAEAKAAAKENDKEALEAAREAAKQARKEATEATKAAAKAPAKKRKQARAEAERKEQEADRKAEEVERLGEQMERREAELRRGTLRTAQMQKLGRGVDAKGVPTTAAASEAAKPSVEATFLHRLHKGACSTFGTVLGPEANEAHRNHFHFDLAPRRRKAYCE